MRACRLLCLALLCGLAPACVPDFAPASELGERPQILAVQAAPPEVAPGDGVVLSALLHEPAPLHRLWIACFADPDDQSDNCVADALAGGAPLSPCGTDPEERLCVLTGDATTVMTVPDWLEPVIPDAGGVPTWSVVTVELVASTAPDPLSACGDAIAAVRPDDQCLLAVKRVVVSHDAAPNGNPAWASLEVDGGVADPGFAVELDPAPADVEDLRVDLTVRLEPASIDDAVDADGTPDETFLDVLWYTDCGSFDGDSGRIRCDPAEIPGDPPTCEPDTARWKPGRTGDCQVHVTAYDGRGGVTWTSQPFRIVTP